jgi:hypothetical protein
MICQDEKASISIRWSDVISAWRTTEARESFFHIGTADHLVPIPLRLFNQDLARTLESFVPTQSLLENSYTKLPQYQRWFAKRRAIVQNTAAVLRVKLTSIKVVGWADVILCSCALLGIFVSRSPEIIVAAFFGIFSLLGAYLLLWSGPIEVNNDGIALITPAGRYYIRWDEVEFIETDIQGQALVLRGAGKCLPLPGPGWWSGKQEADIIEFLTAQIEERNIIVRQTTKALFSISRNTKVKNGTLGCNQKTGAIKSGTLVKCSRTARAAGRRRGSADRW